MEVKTIVPYYFIPFRMANMNPYRGWQGHREVGNSHALLVGTHTGTGILETKLTELRIV